MIGIMSGVQGRMPIQGSGSTRSPRGKNSRAMGSARASWTGVLGASRTANSAPVVSRMPSADFLAVRFLLAAAVVGLGTTPALADGGPDGGDDDGFVPVEEVPRTLSGKKCEVPVKRILAGADPEKAVSRGALKNPEALEPFLKMAGRA